jgi:hypothetical protein
MRQKPRVGEMKQMKIKDGRRFPHRRRSSPWVTTTALFSGRAVVVDDEQQHEAGEDESGDKHGRRS